MDVGLSLFILERGAAVLAENNIGAQADVVRELGVVVGPELGVVLLRHEGVVVRGVEGSELLELRAR